MPVIELQTELALTSRGPILAERFEQVAGQMRENGGLRVRFAVRLAGWAAVAGMDIELDWSASGPYAAMMRRDWRTAADEFGELGWSYDRALMLSLLDDEPALVEVIEIGRRLGAGPLTKRVGERMRGLGPARPAGPPPDHQREPGRAHRSPARGADAHRGGPDERGNRRAAGRVAADRRAPRGRGPHQAGRHHPARRRPAGI